MMAGFGSRQLTFDAPTAPSIGPPAGLLDLYGAALETQRAQKNAFWIEDEREKAYDAHAAMVRAETGIELPNPVRQKRNALNVPGIANPGALATRLTGYSPMGVVFEDQYQAEIEKLATQHPDKAGLLRPDQRPDFAVVERAAKAERSEADLVERRGGSWWLFTDPLALAAQFTGSMRGMIEDPLNALMLTVGPTRAVGLGGRALAWSAVKNGVANAGVEATQQPFVQSWRKRAGLESGLTHALGDIGMAFAFGGAVDLGVRAGYRGIGRARGWTPELAAEGGVKKWNSRQPANDAAPGTLPAGGQPGEAPVAAPARGRIEPEDALDQSARTAPPSSRIRQAVDGDMDSLHMVAKEAGVDRDPAYRGARRAAEIDDALIPPPPKGMDPDAHQAALQQAARASVDPNEPPPFLPPREAEAFSALSEKGQAAVLEAGRRQEQLIGLLRSEEGQQAEARLKSGTADPVDVAATIRDMSALDTADLPRTPGIEMGRELARLSDEAFARIENGHAPPEHGQVVARMVPNPHDHATALDMLARARPADVTEARAVISDFLQRPNPAVHEAVLGVDGPAARRQGDGINDPAGPEAKAQTETLRRDLTANLARPDMIDKLRLSLREAPALDMSPAARKARAEAMGFDTSKVWYHGTSATFEAFVLGSKGRPWSKNVGVFVSEDTRTSEKYARSAAVKDRLKAYLAVEQENAKRWFWQSKEPLPDFVHGLDGQRLDLYVRPGRQAVIDAAQFASETDRVAREIQRLKSSGYDSVIIRGNEDNPAGPLQNGRYPDELVVFDPANLRSVNADFDPAKGDSATLMARLTSTEYTPAFARAQAQLRDDIIAQAVKTLPPSVRIKVEDRIRIGAYELNGYYSRRDNILAVALDAEADPTFRHERIHALRAHELFTDAEWRLLTERANKDGMRAEIGREDLAQYRHLYGRQIALDRIATRIDPELAKLGWTTLEPHLVKAGLYDPKDPRGSLTRAGLWDEARLQGMLDEEAVAKLAERWQAGERFGARIDRVLERVMQFLEAVRNVLAGHGFHTVDDVFRRIETGEVGMRKHREHTLPGGAKVRGVLIRDLMASIKAFHGSPHDFDKFSLDKIGTGEGAQAFGHGLYFAENAKVAESYRNGLSGGEILAADGMPTGHADVDFELANRFGGNWEAFKRYHGGPLATSELARKIAELDARGGVTFKPAGSIYEVRLNLEQSDLLDWSAPLAEQPDAVRKLAQTMQRDLEAKVLGETDGVSDNYLHELTGADLLYEVQRKITGLRVTDEHALGAFEDVNSPAVTKVLQEYGLKGISYFDGQSRGTGAGTRNYVVFDDSLIEIVAKDGMPVDPLKADTTAAKRAGELGQMAEACKL